MTLRLKIMVRAVQIRLRAGEELADILMSYPKLSEEDKAVIQKEVS